MLYDVFDLLFWWFRAPGSGLTFSFLYFKDKKKNWRGRGTSTNEQCCLNCQCIAVICFFLQSLKLWHLLHFKSTVSCYLSVVKSTLHAENHPNQRIYGGAEAQRCHVSTTNGQVRQADIRVQSSARTFGSTDNSHSQNGSYSEALLWNISKISEFDSWKREYYLKGSLKSLFYYFFWLILYIIFSQILFQCFINRKDCKYN